MTMKFMMACAASIMLCGGTVGVVHYCNSPHQVQPRVERGCGMGR